MNDFENDMPKNPARVPHEDLPDRTVADSDDGNA